MSAVPPAVPFRTPAEVDAAIPATVSHLANHGVIAYPTETIYGIGGAADTASLAALLSLKPRMRGKPILVLVSSLGMIERLGLTLGGAAAALAARFWPGPLTLVLPSGSRSVPDLLRGPEGGVAVRWTSHPGMQALVDAFGHAITSTSANRPGAPPSMQADEVLSLWMPAVTSGTLRILDGGTLAPSEPSTVVDCTSRAPRVIRPGAIGAAQLRETAPDLVGDR